MYTLAKRLYLIVFIRSTKFLNASLLSSLLFIFKQKSLFSEYNGWAFWSIIYECQKYGLSECAVAWTFFLFFFTRKSLFWYSRKALFSSFEYQKPSILTNCHQYFCCHLEWRLRLYDGRLKRTDGGGGVASIERDQYWSCK